MGKNTVTLDMVPQRPVRAAPVPCSSRIQNPPAGNEELFQGRPEGSKTSTHDDQVDAVRYAHRRRD